MVLPVTRRAASGSVNRPGATALGGFAAVINGSTLGVGRTRSGRQILVATKSRSVRRSRLLRGRPRRTGRRPRYDPDGSGDLPHTLSLLTSGRLLGSGREDHGGHGRICLGRAWSVLF